MTPNRVRLDSNGTNLGLFKVQFDSTVLKNDLRNLLNILIVIRMKLNEIVIVYFRLATNGSGKVLTTWK